MVWFFLICAIFGGTILICQFVMTLIGMGSDSADFIDDMPDAPHDFGHDAAGHHPEGHTHGSEWLFGVISFRTLTAAFTFFGLAGYAAYAAKVELPGQLGAAVLFGAAAMFGVHWLMRSLMRLSENGTARIERAVGQEGTVYLTIPAARRSAGKIQFRLQNRLVEYPAITASDRNLPTGSKIRIVGVTGGSTLEVEPAEATSPA